MYEPHTEVVQIKELWHTASAKSYHVAYKNFKLRTLINFVNSDVLLISRPQVLKRQRISTRWVVCMIKERQPLFVSFAENMISKTKT